MKKDVFKDDDFCLVCGKENPIGFKVNFIRTEENTYFELAIPKEFQGYNGIVHGGIISTLLDEIMVHAAITKQKLTVTAEISVRFKKPVLVEIPMIFEGTVEHIGKKIVQTKGIAKDKNGVIYATSTAKLFIIGEV